jgi:integrase
MKNLITVKGKLEKMPEPVLKSGKNIKAWLVEQNTEEQARRCLMQLKACCDWAIEQELMVENPFTTLKRLKRSHDHEHEPNPFSLKERDLIIETFETLQPYYLNFVKFLFFTGCRPSEACALKWENIYFEEKYFVFCESLVEGHWSNSLKTQSQRRFPINEQLNIILLSQKQEYPTVFTSVKGNPIDLHNFANKVWSPLLKNLSIEYRGCYHCRHTFITLCLDSNVPIQQVAKWVGNSPEIILRHYAGLTKTEVPVL